MDKVAIGSDKPYFRMGDGETRLIFGGGNVNDALHESLYQRPRG